MRRALLAAGITWATLAAPPRLHAQVPDGTAQPVDTVTAAAGTTPCLRIGAIGSVTEDRARTAQLTGETSPASWLLRRSDALRTTCAADPARRPAGLVVLPPALTAGLRSGYEGGRNDGALWQGKGVSAALSGGVRLQYSVLTLDFAPVLTYQQNAEFALAPVLGGDTLPVTPYANPWFPASLDIPQRFGDGSFTRFDLGQSRLAAQLGPVEIGFSNQNLWWGPGVHNALLMTNTAAGFPHGHVSTARPLDIGFARLEFSLVGGKLRGTEYQDTSGAERESLFRGLVLTLEPKVLEHLYLGAARSFVGRWEEFTAGEFLELLLQSPFTKNVRSEENPSGNSPGNQLISFFARWVMPADRFEVWGEWGREDHAGDIDDLLQEPDHSQGWVLGLQKLLGPEDRPLRVGGEWTDISHFTPPRADRGYANWYMHEEASYTQRGQWLGTATGTGGDSQHLWVDALRGESSFGAYFERVRRQDHAYYITRCCTTLRGHDVELTLGVRGATRWQDFDLHAAIEGSHRYNRSFLADYDNLGVRVGASWWPRPEHAGTPAGQ